MINADLYNEDCITGMRERIADESVHLTVTSIPFEELFTYSGKLEDVGNNGSTVDIRTGRFALNLRFVIAQLWRVTAPGCNVCIHIQQLLAYKNQHGFMGRRDFRGAVIDLFIKGGEFRQHVIDEDGNVLPVLLPHLNAEGTGFQFVGEVAIPKDPQAMAQRLNLHSLQFKTGYARNGCDLAPAVNDFVLIFQKPGDHPCPPRPLIHPSNPAGWITTDEWIDWASGVWRIDAFDILDGYRNARASTEEKHVCPLQLEVIRRCVKLYTNPAAIQPDVRVLDPFMGIGSTAHECVLLGRNVMGFELKESYYASSLGHVKAAREKVDATATENASLFESTEAA